MFFLAYILLSSGISIIITQSIFFEKLRNAIERRSPFFGEGISCPMCTGFWVGIFLSLMGISPAHLYIFPLIQETFISENLVYYFMNFSDGVISSMLSWGYYNLIIYLQDKQIQDLLNEIKEDEKNIF